MIPSQDTGVSTSLEPGEFRSLELVPEGLVYQTKEGLKTDSLIISVCLNQEHRSVMQLIRKYEMQLSLFGGVTFEMQPFETAGGMQNRKVAVLTEEQATLLISFMKNTDNVVRFKVDLVKAFYMLRKKLQNLPSEDPVLALTYSIQMMREDQNRFEQKIDSKFEEVEEKLKEVTEVPKNRKLVVESPSSGYENKEDVIATVAKLTGCTKAIAGAVIESPFYRQNITRSKYMVERIDDLKIVPTYPVCYYTMDVINCVKHAVGRSTEFSPCFRIFPTLGNKRMKYKGAA